MKNPLKLHVSLLATSTYFNLSSLKLTTISVILLCLAAFNVWWVLLNNAKLAHVNPQSSTASDFSPASRFASRFCSSLLIRSKSCELTKGKWLPDPTPPLYTNDTCSYIFPNQDCMKNGRPDRAFLSWRWHPSGCELPPFDPRLFLKLMTGKRMLFVGDSLGRNQMEALLCALVQVEAPQALPQTPDMLYNWAFSSYNFTLAMVWSPYLVNYTAEEELTFNIHLDKPHKAWTSVLSRQDIAVFSAAYWFFRRSIHYLKDKPVSTYDPNNSTSTDQMWAVRMAWRTVLKYLVKHYTGMAILRTVSVSHFEDKTWDKGGTCNKTQPYSDPKMDMALPWMHGEIHKIQTEELKKALASKSVPVPILKLLDVTYSTLLRPDGHPGAYRIQSSTEPLNDCGHWCLPGPIDMWNQFLFADPEIMCL